MTKLIDRKSDVKGISVQFYSNYDSGSKITTLSMSDLRDSDFGDCREVWQVEYTLHGDYAGSLLEKSNCKAFMGAFGELADNEFAYEFWSDFGSNVIIIDPNIELDDDDAQEVIDTLDGLSNYPLIDEELHTEMEMELIQEHYDNDLYGDLVRELEEAFKVCEDYVITIPSKDDMRELLQSALDDLNAYPEVEGVSYVCYPDMEGIIEHIIEHSEDLKSLNDAYVRGENMGEAFDELGSVLVTDDRLHRLIEGLMGDMSAYDLEQIITEIDNALN